MRQSMQRSPDRRPTSAEREMISQCIRRLQYEADDYYENQQKFLRLSYRELCSHMDQLKLRAQFFVNPGEDGPAGHAGSPDPSYFSSRGGGVGSSSNSSSRVGNAGQPSYSVPFPLSATPVASHRAGGGFLAEVQSLSTEVLHGTSATPLKQTAGHRPGGGGSPSSPLGDAAGRSGLGAPPARALSPNDFTTNSFHANLSGPPGTRSAGRLAGEARLGALAGTGTSTPPNKYLTLSAEGKSPSLSTLLDDTVGGVSGAVTDFGDWGSLSLANNTQGGHASGVPLHNGSAAANGGLLPTASSGSLDASQAMMASPQVTGTLSLDDLLRRFMSLTGDNAEGFGGGNSPVDGVAAADTGAPTFAFDALYEQLVGSVEKSRSPEVDAVVAPAPALAARDRGIATPPAFGMQRDQQTDGESKASAPGEATGRGKGDAADRMLFGSATAPTRGSGGGNSPLQSTPSATRQGPRAPAPRSHKDPGSSPDRRTPLGADASHPHAAGAAALALETPPLSAGATSRDAVPVESIRSLCAQHLTRSVKATSENGRPKVVHVAAGERQEDEEGPSESAATSSATRSSADDPASLGIDVRRGCQVLVEFKRKRVVQYDANQYLSPGSYVLVGGDRGEDLGLVIYTWCESNATAAGRGTSGGSDPDAAAEKAVDAALPSSSLFNRGSGGAGKSGGFTQGGSATVVGVGLRGSSLTRSIGVGSGTVLQLATKAEVQRLLTVQTELESRAIDVCGQRVLEHGLPMVIVDAEYQFDRKKLTFFYEAQQRMDFRDLVRDLYKTFRARIWMELVDN